MELSPFCQFLVFITGSICAEGYLLWYGNLRNISFGQTSQMSNSDVYWVVGSLFSLLTSWLGLFGLIVFTLGASLGRRAHKRKGLSKKRRFQRLLRLHFSQILDIVFSGGVVIATLILYFVMR
jgi:hypothetical protein